MEILLPPFFQGIKLYFFKNSPEFEIIFLPRRIATGFASGIMDNTNCKLNLQQMPLFRFSSYFPSSGKNGRSICAIKRTTATEHIDAHHTAGMMSKGCTAPYPARTAATVDGIS